MPYSDVSFQTTLNIICKTGMHNLEKHCTELVDFLRVLLSLVTALWSVANYTA